MIQSALLPFLQGVSSSPFEAGKVRFQGDLGPVRRAVRQNHRSIEGKKLDRAIGQVDGPALHYPLSILRGDPSPQGVTRACVRSR